MALYYICPICREPIEVDKYKNHFEAHGESETGANLERLKKIMDEATRTWNNNPRPLSLSFEIAKGIIRELERVDTSSWDYVFDYEYPEIIAQAKIAVPSTFPPIMCHIRFKIKDKTKFDELIKKYKGTEKEHILKAMVSTSIPTIVVYFEEWNRVYSTEWKPKGMKSSDVTIMTAYFFLHEMYHILGLGEKDAGPNASIAIYQIFNVMVGIPEHEIKRWKQERESNKPE